MQEIYKEAVDLGLLVYLFQESMGNGITSGTSLHGIGFFGEGCVSTSTQLAFFSAIGDMLADLVTIV